MRRAYKFKLYRSDQTRKLDAKRRVAAQIYNRSIAMHKRYYRMFGKHLDQGRLKSRLAYLRKNVHPEWKILTAQSVQDIVERIERGYDRFFDSLKRKGRKVRPPSFKKARKYKSFTLKVDGWKLIDNGVIRVGKKNFHFKQHREINGKIKTVTIGRDAVGDWWISFSVDLGEMMIVRAATGKTAGFDFGLKNFLTANDGEKLSMPTFFKADLKAIAKASRSLSRKKKGSKNRRKARLHLARLHRRIAWKRKDFHFKLALELVRKYDVICIEDLNLRGMQAMWGRKVSDYGFSQFVEILEAQCKRHGTQLLKVDRFYPSTKTCSECGLINNDLSLRDREWTCTCGAQHDRDHNAAKNIHREALRLHCVHAGHGVLKEAA